MGSWKKIWYLMILWASILFILFGVSCAGNYLVTAVHPVKTKAPVRNRIKVMLRLSSKSLLRNRVAVVNRSPDKVVVYPVDIALHIPEKGVILPAVIDYKNYVSMRHEEALKQCSGGESPGRCEKYADKFFKRFLRVKTFGFGEISPGSKRTGYFAFNLPDPLNITEEAKRVKKLLIGNERIIEGKIVVTVSTVAFEPEKNEFVFPVKIITSSEEDDNVLKIMRIF